jgi:hypothetical protein
MTPRSQKAGSAPAANLPPATEFVAYRIAKPRATPPIGQTGRVYAYLLQHPDSTAGELARALRLKRKVIEGRVWYLKRKGIVAATTIAPHQTGVSFLDPEQS